MASTTVRISDQTHRILQELSASTGQSMQSILDTAIEAYRRELFLRDTNAAFAALRADPEAWREELAERAVWDATLGDGLEED